MGNYILMADVIDSRNKNQEKLMVSFKSVVNSVNLNFKDNILSPLTITLGDEFQGVTKDLQTSLDIIIFLEEARVQHNLDFMCRYVLKYGEIDTPLNLANAHEMMGAGLTNARERLEEIKAATRFSVMLDDENISLLLNESFIVYDNIVSNWNIERDNEIIYSFLVNKDYKIVAEQLNRNRSLMWKRDKSLNIAAYNSIKNIINLSSKL